MRNDMLRDVVFGVALAGLVLTFVFGFSPALAWAGVTFFGY